MYKKTHIDHFYTLLEVKTAFGSRRRRKAAQSGWRRRRRSRVKSRCRSSTESLKSWLDSYSFTSKVRKTESWKTSY
jgi:hypothetical protein